MNWSGSKLGLLQLCPHAFAEDHVRGVPRPPHPALAGGSSTHAGLKRIVDAEVADESFDVDRVAREVCAGRPEELQDTAEILGLVNEQLLDDPPPFRGAAVMYCEQRLAMPIGPHIFDGQADVVERYGDECRILDFKTHWRPLTQLEFEAQVQLPRYALLIDHHHTGEFTRYRLRHWYVRYRGAFREMVITREDLEAVKWNLVQEIEEAEARIAAGDFPATPGDWCSICSRTDTCPVVQDFLEHGLDLTMVDDVAAACAAATVRAIDAHSAKLKRMLKAYLGADHPTGRVQLAGGSYGYGPAHHKRADAGDVMDVFQAHNRPVNRHVLRVDVDELQRALDREPGAVRSAMRAVIDEYDQADCRYRRGESASADEPSTVGAS
jgi:hypothetical protein